MEHGENINLSANKWRNLDMGLSKYNSEKNIVVTIIIPVFNQSHTIKRCLDSILSGQDFITKEILLINDGSSDDSEVVCKGYANEYGEVKYFYQNNSGVSAARNLGIRNATGKYIFYLDADDELETGTIEKVTEFFETVQDEVDMVTYKIDTIYAGRLLKPHFRYNYLMESKVYDLCTMPYIGQTTMNIVVRNKFKDNILFDETQSFSEDQRYCCDVLKNKLKIGYCAHGRYIYYRDDTSSSGRLSGACYIFEQCTKFFEDLFEQYDEVPMAFQGLFVNDFAWKLATNILLPYHYEGDKYTEAVGRLKKLLNRCDVSVIAGHPQIDFYEKFYMLRMKENSGFFCSVNYDGYKLISGDKCYVSERTMEIVLTKISVKGTKVRIRGFLKTVFFQFYDEMPTLCAYENDSSLIRKVNLYPSAHNYYISRENTQRFWAFSYECDVTEVQNVRFKVEVGEYWFPVKYYFMPLIPFSHRYKKYRYECQNVRMRINDDNMFIFNQINRKQNSEIWLYYDCSGVAIDNGLKQFLHDYIIKDNVERYYVVSDDRQMEYLPDSARHVRFGSAKHKKLMTQASKIITAYIEELNILPYSREEYDKVANSFKFEVIYLQHGVLHIDMPWKYTPERIMADRVVVSTEQEAELFIRNGFDEKDLIKSRMPRFATKHKKTTKSHKILFAPSWRAYLVGAYKDHVWQRQDAKFLASTYYKKIHGLLNNPELERLLRDCGYIMEIKLHPIFAQYENHFGINSERIRFISKESDIIDYDLFVTDFSSFMYDFLFQGIPVLLFLPDEEEFRSGMNGYRRLGDDRAYSNRVCTDEEKLLEKIRHCITGSDYYNINVDFFDEDNPCTRIYEKLANI